MIKIPRLQGLHRCCSPPQISAEILAKIFHENLKMFIFEDIFAKLETNSMTNCIAYMIRNNLVFKNYAIFVWKSMFACEILKPNS
jgi:hypothetical protein